MQVKNIQFCCGSSSIKNKLLKKHTLRPLFHRYSGNLTYNSIGSNNFFFFSYLPRYEPFEVNHLQIKKKPRDFSEKTNYYPIFF